MKIKEAVMLAEKTAAGLDMADRPMIILGTSRTRLATLNEAGDVIYLSRPAVLINGEREVTYAVLHQLAHVRSGDRTHGLMWRASATGLGCPTTTVAQHRAPKPRFALYCYTCSKTVARSNVRTDRGRYCLNCGPFRGSLAWHRL